MPRKPKAVPPQRSAHVRTLTDAQRAELLAIVKAPAAVDELAKIVALYGAPVVRRAFLPADWTATLRPIADALTAAAMALHKAPEGARTRIALRLYEPDEKLMGAGAFMAAAGPDTKIRPHCRDALAEAEVTLGRLVMAAHDALASIPTSGGRPTDRARLLAHEVRLVLLRAGIPLKSAWPRVLALVIEAAELPRLNAATAIASLQRSERRRREGGQT